VRGASERAVSGRENIVSRGFPPTIDNYRSDDKLPHLRTNQPSAAGAAAAAAEFRQLIRWAVNVATGNSSAREGTEIWAIPLKPCDGVVRMGLLHCASFDISENRPALQSWSTNSY